MFKVRLVKFEKAIAMQVLEMDESLRKAGCIYDSELGDISSNNRPQLNDQNILLRGTSEEHDLDIVMRDFDSNLHRDEYFIRVVKLLRACKEALTKPKVAENTRELNEVII